MARRPLLTDEERRLLFGVPGDPDALAPSGWALSAWRRVPVRGSLRGMTISSNPYRGFRFPREVIEHAVWLYHCFSLSLRDVELILAARGIVVS